MMTFDEMIEVLQAAKRGEKVQFRRRGDVGPYQDTASPNWEFSGFDYRAKPTPLEGWVNFYCNESIGNNFYATKDMADARANCSIQRCVHVREVEE